MTDEQLQPRSSVEKIHALAAEYSGPPTPDDGPQELMLRSAAQVVGPMFLPMIPDDPAMLDQALVEMATKLLELRSDHSDDELVIAELGAAGNWQPLQLEAGSA